MLVVCNALLDNDMQIENLCQCIKILGGNPQVDGCSVSVTFEGATATAEKFVELFEQYPFHGISTLD